MTRNVNSVKWCFWNLFWVVVAFRFLLEIFLWNFYVFANTKRFWLVVLKHFLFFNCYRTEYLDDGRMLCCFCILKKNQTNKQTNKKQKTKKITSNLWNQFWCYGRICFGHPTYDVHSFPFDACDRMRHATDFSIWKSLRVSQKVGIKIVARAIYTSLFFFLYMHFFYHTFLIHQNTSWHVRWRVRVRSHSLNGKD